MNEFLVYSLLSLTVILSHCSKSAMQGSRPPLQDKDTLIRLTTDRSCYAPGATVTFTANGDLPATVRVRYSYLDSTIADLAVPARNWTWTAPARDFSGYLAQIYGLRNGKQKVYGSIAVDVSSDWARFPRYGFLSQYGSIGADSMRSVISRLSRYHINGLQFYDWEYKHHMPLAGTPSDPDSSWRDIAGRMNYRATVKGYIGLAHARGMKAMSYNLVYGALDSASSEGVSSQWYMYTDSEHGSREFLDLPSPPFKSDIYLTDPSNTGWQEYLASRTNEMYQVYDFDGYHADQVGDLNKPLYTWQGVPIDLKETFGPFLKAMKSAAPSKRLVMNAVNQYGQQASIAGSPVDFLYTEVWAPHEGYADLADIIRDNDDWGTGKKTVLAAYMDYDLAASKGYFNTAGVLLTDAVIFSFGGDHLELGDHMLCKEYFPNDNLQMRAELQDELIRYYDFLTAYENLLRDGGSFNTPSLQCTDGQFALNAWPPRQESVSFTGKEIGGCEVIHLINFTHASSLKWRDANGTQTTPYTYHNVGLRYAAPAPVKKVWMATPDLDGGVAYDLAFRQSGSSVTFTLPSLEYWDMIVIEY